jgi:DMSO/TMAO reductase YedYZ molybdopterin-dependent catalytic subunit
MSELITRRKLITTGLATAAGVTGVAAAAKIADRYGLIPPDHSGIFGAGETLTYAAQRILMSRHSMAREFSRGEISQVIPVNGKHPETEEYKRLLAGDFADWKVTIDGLVARPTSFSLADLKRFPAYTQITHQACEEGWSFIAEWKGVRLSDVLNAVGIAPQAKWVFYFSIDKDWWDSLDVPDAMHPQTFLAFGMNGKEIPLDHGAPVRLRVPRQLGYKSLKFVNRITVTDTMKGIGDGLGSASPSAGYSWYAGI